MEILIGLLTGVVLGLTGAGGSVFAVPLFLLFTDYSVSNSMGIALGAVAVSATYGTATQGRKFVLWAPAMLLAFGGMIAAPFGKWLGIHLNETFLLAGFCLLALAIALRMWLQASNNPQDSLIVRGTIAETEDKPSALLCRLSPSGQFQLKPRCLSGLIVGGLIIGFMSGLFGVGGGFLIIPLLLFLSQLSMRVAVATSLFVIAVISSAGFASHLYFTPNMDWPLLAKIMFASIFGMVLSQALSGKIAGAKLQKIFALSLVFISLVTLFGRLL